MSRSNFPFQIFKTYERRPGLVLVSGEMDLLVARLTTHPPRDLSDVAMKCWSEIGLPRASIIRLTKLVTIDHRLVHHKIGRLHPDDGRAVMQAWQQMITAFAAELLK